MSVESVNEIGVSASAAAGGSSTTTTALLIGAVVVATAALGLAAVTAFMWRRHRGKRSKTGIKMDEDDVVAAVPELGDARLLPQPPAIAAAPAPSPADVSPAAATPAAPARQFVSPTYSWSTDVDVHVQPPQAGGAGRTPPGANALFGKMLSYLDDMSDSDDEHGAEQPPPATGAGIGFLGALAARLDAMPQTEHAMSERPVSSQNDLGPWGIFSMFTGSSSDPTRSTTSTQHV